jgi:hypothetical protein
VAQRQHRDEIAHSRITEQVDGFNSLSFDVGSGDGVELEAQLLGDPRRDPLVLLRSRTLVGASCVRQYPLLHAAWLSMDGRR